MSAIIFHRRMNYLPPGERCETEKEVEEDHYNFNHANINSKSYLVNLYKNLKNCNYFLNSLVNNERLDYVVISLFKNHKFSFGIKVFDSEFVFERVQFTCEDTHIINYIDNEELPPKLIDVIEMFDFKNIYYNGCIISQIRDYRQSSTNFFNSYFILLKPTSLSLYNDVKKIISLTNKTYTWSNSARLKLESKLIYLTSPKLCLDPNPRIGILSKKLSRKKLIFGNKLFLELPRKRMRTMFANDRLQEFTLLNYIKAKKKPVEPRKRLPARKPKKVNSLLPSLAKAKFKQVQKVAKSLPQHAKTGATGEPSYELIRHEEYLLEVPETQITTKLIILKRPFDQIFYGSILHTKNVADGEEKPSPNFYLGPERMKRTFVDQFVETFSENGRKLTQITHTVGATDENKTKYIYAQSLESIRLRQPQTLIKTKLNGLEMVQVSPKAPTTPAAKPDPPPPEPVTIANNTGANIKSVVVVSMNNNAPGTEASTVTMLPATTKISPNQIVIKHSNLKLINAVNLNKDGDPVTGIHQISQQNQGAAKIHHHQQPVMLNVSTTRPNGTQIPIRIPLSFSLQQLKSGRLALVPTSGTANATGANIVVNPGGSMVAATMGTESSPITGAVPGTTTANVNLIFQANNIFTQAQPAGRVQPNSQTSTIRNKKKTIIG